MGKFLWVLIFWALWFKVWVGVRKVDGRSEVM